MTDYSLGHYCDINVYLYHDSEEITIRSITRSYI